LDGVTKPHILFLLGAFYRNIGDSYKKQARKQANAQNALDRTLTKMPVVGHIAVQTFGEGAYSR
jgi:hypothetical protein